MRRLALALLILCLSWTGTSLTAEAQIDPPVRYPGVYIEEQSSFPALPVIDTAVPVFIGYTERAERDGGLISEPALIDSMASYVQIYGGAPPLQYLIHEAASGDRQDFEIDGTAYSLALSAASHEFYLYNSLRYFFANGGSKAYIVSVGDYNSAVDAADFSAGLEQARKLDRPKPTLLLAPDALLLSEADYYGVANQMLAQAGALQSRFAIIDVYKGDQELSTDPITQHRTQLGNDHLRYGASYYPFLATSIVDSDEIDRSYISEVGCGIWLSDLFGDEVDGPNGEAILAGDEFGKIQDAIARRMNVLPPGPAMAGIFTANDETDGVWKSPANVDLQATVAPLIAISNTEQADLNVDVATGKSVNAIRSFPGRGGATIWGARTLDGNSGDWRYISVQRTVMMIEEAVSQITTGYSFSDNNATTWSSVQLSLESYLQTLWQQGALQGATPSDAYSVNVGLGSTMTATDVEDGLMRVELAIALQRPAEFIIIRSEQKMAE